MSSEPLQILPRPEHALEAAQADIGVDVDERADLGGAGRDHPAGDPARLGVSIDPALAPQRPFVVDLVEQRRANLVAVPPEPEEGLVDVSVAVDEPREDEPRISLDRGCVRRRWEARVDRYDPAALDQDVDRTAAQRADIPDEQRLWVRCRRGVRRGRQGHPGPPYGAR